MDELQAAAAREEARRRRVKRFVIAAIVIAVVAIACVLAYSALAEWFYDLTSGGAIPRSSMSGLPDGQFG